MGHSCTLGYLCVPFKGKKGTNMFPTVKLSLFGPFNPQIKVQSLVTQNEKAKVYEMVTQNRLNIAR